MGLSLTSVHYKTDTIADWTQAELDAQIALGNYPPGTLLADIVLPSDWNTGHVIPDGLRAMSYALSDYALVNMANSDLTLAVNSINSFVGYIVLLNCDGAYTLTYGFPFVELVTQRRIDTRFITHDVIISYNGNTVTIPAGGVYDITITAIAVVAVFTYTAFFARQASDGTNLFSASASTQASDKGKTIVFDTAACTYTIETSSAADMGENAFIRVGYTGATGTLTIGAGAGVTLTGATSVYPNDWAFLQRDGTTESWYCFTSSPSGVISNGVVIKTTVTETTAVADAGKRVYCSNASAVTFTIAPSSSFDLGANATFRLQAGAGGVTIAAGAGVTLVGSTTVAAYDCITCDRDGTTETWYL